MTQEEIIEMARQAGMDYIEHISEDSMSKVKAFVKLIASEERKGCLAIVKDFIDSPDLDEAVEFIKARGES
jgi:Asp/Glu/hydantoin racemase